MNKSKRVLSFILAFILSLSTALSYVGTIDVSAEDEEILNSNLYVEDTYTANSGSSAKEIAMGAQANALASGLPGSGVGPESPTRNSSWTSHPGDRGFASTWGFRIRLIPTDCFSGNDYDYFTVSHEAGSAIDKINLTADITGSSYHSDNDGWYYILPCNADARTYTFCLGGSEFTATGYGKKSSIMDNLIDALGVKGDLEKFSTWDDALRSYTKYGQGHEDDDELAMMFNVTPGSYYIVVIEGLRAIYVENANLPVVDKFVWTSWQDFNYNRSVTEGIMGCHISIGSVARSCLSDVGRYINQGAIAPFGLEWMPGQPIQTGFCVYGDINGTASEPFALNLTLEYQGLPNTSDADKFVASSSLVQYDEDTGKKSYWDKDNKRWVETSDDDTLLQQTKKGVEIEDPYSIAFEDYYCIRHQVFDVSMTQLLNTADANNKYYGVPGASSGYQLTWGKIPVNAGDANVGFSIKPSTLNGNASTHQILISFLVKLGNGTVQVGSRMPNNDYTAKTILEACVDNVVKAYARTEESAVGINQETKELKLKKGKKLGTAVEFIVKGSEVESHKVTVNIAADGSVTSSETWNDKYSSAGNTIADIDGSAKCFVTVPNKFRNDANVEGALSHLADRDAETLILATKNALGEANIKLAQKKNGISIGVGCEPDLDGYTIYEILVAGDSSTGAVELPSYMLNRYFQNIIQKSSNPTTKYQVNKDFTRKKEAYSGSVTCSNCSAAVEYTTRSEDVKYWKLIWTDISSGTKHTDYDKGALLGRYFINMNSDVWEHAKRAELVSGVTKDTENWSVPSGYVMDYGFNLIRASVDDNRAISGIANADYVSVDADNLLQIKDNFGVVPASSPKAASGKRDPMATAGTVSDTLTIKSEYDLTKSKDGYDEEICAHTHEAVTGTPPNYTDKKDAVNIPYYKINGKETQGFYKKVGSDVGTANKLEYTFTSTVRKYQTDTIVDGENSKIVAPATHTPISTNASKVNDGEVQDGNEYRFANVRYNNIAIHFYPEVKMVTCIGGTDWASVASTGYKPVATMGEEKRTSKSSSLYLFKLNRVDGSSSSITGTTYTDSAEGGTSIKGSSKITIPAGSDVYVAADPDGVTVDLYGYTLDCIDATIDATFKTSASTTRNYTDVVKSGENVDTKWNGSANKDTLKAHFETWANNVLNVENFSADFELYVSGSKKADNFSAVVGRIQRGSTTATEDGVYQLQVANGALVKNDDYSKMIAQIAADYQCSDSEAEAVFEASGIYTAILNAIESSTSSFNKSGVCGLNMTWTSQLGNSTNWYDEKVDTFVVRRFTNLNNKIKDITATDKIDFGLAPSSRGGTKQNSNYNNTNGASWKLNVFFNPSVKEYLVGDGSFYNPGDTSVSIGGANDTYTVLMRGVPVTNADFNISSTSTSDFKN